MHRSLALFLVALPLAAGAQTKPVTPAPAAQPAATQTAPPSVAAPKPVPPAKQAKIEKLLSLLTVDTGLQKRLDGTKADIHRFAAQRGATAANDGQKKIAADYVSKMDVATNELLVWQPLKDNLVNAYADAFTDAELDAYIAFYSSPAGQTFIAKSPQIAERDGMFERGLNQKLMLRIQTLTRDFDTKFKAAAPLTLQPLDPSAPAQK